MAEHLDRLKTADFDYELPEGFIAQTPAQPRDSARLLVYDRTNDRIMHSVFNRLTDYLGKGDLLVVNQTRVIRARIFGKKASTGGKVEILLLNQLSPKTWEAIVGGKRIHTGIEIQINDGPSAVVVRDLEGAKRIIEFSEPVRKNLVKIGRVPLPPYIHSELADDDYYQTVFARIPGSSAAPTAGLHFTADLISRLKRKGVNIAEVDLKIGLDTFVPVIEDDPSDHKIHSEFCSLSKETAEIINQTRQNNGRIVAVGTTSVRVLETAARNSPGNTCVSPFIGPTDLFILPGYKFQIIDAIITNFHLPRSTLIMMVSAFTNRERLLEIYEMAKKEKYRFYSFGDAMFIY